MIPLRATPFVLVALLSCARPTPPPDEATVRAQAQTSLAPFKAALKSELTAALATGPEAAIEVCGSRAPALAAQHSAGGVRVGRSSPKLRSAANAAPPWLVPVMAELAREPGGTPASRVTALPDGRWGYAEAIWMQPPCLACHGESLAPPIDAELRKRYPSDAARGYRAGDFRGVFFAEIERTALAPRR
ncbi:DUF3365 domain-containing protein [soil metagenome]